MPLRLMTVARLREILSEAQDDAVVLVPGDDRSYRMADARVTTAVLEGPRVWSEDPGGDVFEIGERVDCVVVD